MTSDYMKKIQCIMFRKQASPLHGYGLFSNSDISKYSYFDVNIEKIYKIRKKLSEKYLLDFFLPSSFSDDAICINNDKVDLLKNIVMNKCDNKKKYVIVDSLYMLANDAAWPSINECEYNDNTCKNNADFVLKFQNGELVGICLILLNDIGKDAEICVTYGWNFWYFPEN